MLKCQWKPPNFSRTPQFQFSPQILATSFCKYDKHFFCKILQKTKQKWQPYGAPDTLSGGGHVPPVPPGCATGGRCQRTS